MNKVKIIIKINSLSKNYKGFSLVETLMAVLILTIAIMAPLTLAMQTVKYSRIAIQKMESTYLAEEGIEIIQNLKKSAQIYCGVYAEDQRCTKEYFNDYFLDQQIIGTNDIIIDSDCFGYLFGTNIKKYCSMDFNNLVYNNTNKKTYLTSAILSSNNTYLTKTPNGMAESTSTPSIYKRSINVTPIDLNEDIDGFARYRSVLVTSIICIQENSICNESSENKIMLQNLISR
ncbi:MAG: hypothetical protein QG614_224 [Patescibacteria group bacterium]|nr:hypothetical protein [Patescibacteria group bacterium]